MDDWVKDRYFQARGERTGAGAARVLTASDERTQKRYSSSLAQVRVFSSDAAPYRPQRRLHARGDFSRRIDHATLLLIRQQVIRYAGF